MRGTRHLSKFQVDETTIRRIPLPGPAGEHLEQCPFEHPCGGSIFWRDLVAARGTDQHIPPHVRSLCRSAAACCGRQRRPTCPVSSSSILPEAVARSSPAAKALARMRRAAPLTWINLGREIRTYFSGFKSELLPQRAAKVA